MSLGLFAEEAAGEDDSCAGASDDELLGVICGWDRVQAHAAARKHAAVAEFIRRRAAAGCGLEGPGRMPAVWDEFAPVELAAVLGESRWAADGLLEVADALEARLPGTRAAFRAGIITEAKAGIIARATALLDPGEARAAEALVLGRAGKLTPPALAAAIARAVMQVAPDKARKRREQAAKEARVERWAEASGNAGLAGRELPPAQVLAADQRVNAWARELRKAGAEGCMDELRAMAYLDLLLNRDSRPTPGSPPGSSGHQEGDGTDAPGGTDSGSPGGRRPAARRRPGSGRSGSAAVRVRVRVGRDPGRVRRQDQPDRPRHHAAGPGGPAGGDRGYRAGRPGSGPGPGRRGRGEPEDDLVRDGHRRDGHAIGHGCARPEPRERERGTPGTPGRPGTSGGPDPPGSTSGPRFTFTPDRRDGPPGGWGTWRLATGIPGRPDLIIRLGPIATDPCDHRYQARGHDPGVLLRHLTQIRYATCTGPGCRRPSAHADFEHSVPYEAGGRTCTCNGDPKCRHDHRLKQHPGWTAEHLADGTIRWTMPSGRQHTTEPTRYPI